MHLVLILVLLSRQFGVGSILGSTPSWLPSTMPERMAAALEANGLKILKDKINYLSRNSLKFGTYRGIRLTHQTQ